MKTVTLEDFQTEGERRFGKERKNWQLQCPQCKQAMIAEDYRAAGVLVDDINKYVGFSCVGRFNDGKKGCDWTLGGLFQIHELEIQDEEGNMHPHFDFPPEEQDESGV